MEVLLGEGHFEEDGLEFITGPDDQVVDAVHSGDLRGRVVHLGDHQHIDVFFHY